MVYRFKFVSDEVVNFAREIEIDPDASFLILRNAVLDSVGYSKDDIDSFILCDDNWESQEEVTLEDMGTSSDTDIWIMDETPIGELVEEEGQKLRFVFDYLTERSFFMELVEIIPHRHIADPICTFKKGNPPKQEISLSEFEEKVDAAAKAQSKNVEDFDNEFYGDTDFNDDELPEGFDDLTLN